MSVLVSDRTESKFEAITYSIELHDMLIDLILYKPYEKMGGNGSAQKIMLEVNKLPIHKSTYVEEN